MPINFHWQNLGKKKAEQSIGDFFSWTLRDWLDMFLIDHREPLGKAFMAWFREVLWGSIEKNNFLL